MKEIMNKLHITVLVLFVLALGACTDNNPKELFSDNATTRINSQKSLVKRTLLDATNGWRVTYFTDDEFLGGFTYLIKFIDEENVEMDSDFGVSKGRITSSKWNVSFGSTVKLSFATANKIHELSDSAKSPIQRLPGQGHRGSVDFLYYGKEGDDLIFRANRRFTKVRFTKATEDDWSNLIKNDAIAATISADLAYKVGENVHVFNYNPSRRFAINMNSEIIDTDFGIGFTPTGIIVSPAINADNGNSYSKFTLNEAKNQFVTDDGEFLITILFPPFNINQNWTINVDGPGEVSDTFSRMFLAVSRANRARWGETLSTNIRFGNTTIRRVTTPGILFRSFTDPSTGAGFSSQYNLSFAGLFGNSNLNITKIAGAFNWAFYRFLEPMVNLITENAPYEVELTPTDNPTEVKLTSISNPGIWFTIKK